MCKILAPASTALLPSFAISFGVYGMAGHWLRVVAAPVKAAYKINFFM
jgi:hypothetical protein